MGAAPSTWIERQTRNECASLWASYTPEIQQRVYNAIRTKLEQGKFVHYDPLRAMEENAVGWRGLQILLHGWFNFRKYGEKYRHAVNARDYLFITEVMDLSEYAGYDLSKISSC